MQRGKDMATPPKHDAQTTRIVTLDFNGGSHVYRNPELGMNIPVRIAERDLRRSRPDAHGNIEQNLCGFACHI